MPAGLPYFAWIDVGETTFTAGHMRWDEQVFSFKLEQNEGDPASLTAVVKRPRNLSGAPIGLLGPGRKIWCWFALDCGPGLVKFRGRLVGIPTSMFEELVTLEFVARPVDVVAQKEALAATLRVLPYYDEVVIDEARRTDPDVVLEGYTKIWHYDRETHVVTVSDEITGEDGTVVFDGTSDTGKVLYDGLGLTLTSGPLARVDVNAEYTWTQQALGTVDLTNYLISNWPGTINGAILSYTMTAADWPKTGAGIGDGWVVAESTAYDQYTYETTTSTVGSTNTVSFFGEEASTTTYTATFTMCAGPLGFPVGVTVFNNNINVSYAEDGDGLRYVASYSRNTSSSTPFIAVQTFKPTLVAGYKAGREYTERVSFSLFADMQSILTDPEDGEALRIDDIRSVNLSETIGGSMPIGDPRRRSYLATTRGNQSLEHLIVLARAHLMKRARVVEIVFAPKLARMPEITLRKSAFLGEPRVGEALGKIIGYSIALDGSDGRVDCEVSIGCTIGRGGTATASDGTPSYASTDYVGFDYQTFIGRIVLVDTSVGYEPPASAPNDDGIEFLSALRAEDVIEQGLVVEFGPDEQEAGLAGSNAWGDGAVTTDPPSFSSSGSSPEAGAQSDYFQTMMRSLETRATFKLKSMSRDFSSDYVVQVTDLKIPAGYDLEAA